MRAGQASVRPELGRSTAKVLFERARAGDGRAREQLIVRYMPLARKIARRYWHSSVGREDLTQVANLALVKAVDRFDPSRGRPFEAFAIPTILGELRRHFRDSTWAVHVARAAQERSKAIQEALERLSREHGRSPTVKQLALYLELTDEEVLDGLQVADAYSASSLDAPAPGSEEDDGALVATLGGCDDGYERVEDEMLLEDALASMSDRERRLLELRFGQELTQAEIGKQLGVSQMQVSRLLRATLTKMHDSLGAGAFA